MGLIHNSVSNFASMSANYLVVNILSQNGYQPHFIFSRKLSRNFSGTVNRNVCNGP